MTEQIHKKTSYFNDLCFIIPLKLLRKTPNVEFYTIPKVTQNLSAVDKVIHKKGAKSPQIKGDKKHYWYMHPHQQDQLIVHEGKRIVELYSKKHGKIETFEVTSKGVKHNKTYLYKGPCIFGWPRNVFHRVTSPIASISTNYARHYKGFDIKTNFNIYDIDETKGTHWVVREGHKDQPKDIKHP
jgi:hypothetical protein